MRLHRLKFVALVTMLAGCADKPPVMPITAMPDRVYSCAEEREFKQEYDALPVFDQMIKIMIMDYKRMRGTVPPCKEE